MARSRKTPPLFEVMRETDRKSDDSRPAGATGGQGAVILPRAAEPGGVHARAASTSGEEAAKLRLGPAHGASPGVLHGRDHPHEEVTGPGKGLVLPWPALLGGAGILIAVVAVIAMLSFNAGAKREREQLLPQDGEAPMVGGEGRPERRGEPPPEDPLNVRAQDAGRTPDPGIVARGNRGGVVMSVFGEDPREAGKNYLVIERLMFDDAMAAAQFLTDNGVASVVVAPEGTKVSDLQQQARGIWLVIAREGFTRDEFRANSARSEEIKSAVVKLGRRWKQDHKGSTNFANCYWNKFGK